MAIFPNATDKNVGHMLHMRRLMLGLSQTEVANGIGVTFQQVQSTKRAPTGLAPAAFKE
jgi:transcriptional regulator with XRE-family HTH domain